MKREAASPLREDSLEAEPCVCAVLLNSNGITFGILALTVARLLRLAG